MGKLNKEKTKRVRNYTDAKVTSQKQQSGSQIACLDLPKGMNSFYFKKEGSYYMDILPYVAGKNNPMADESYDHWERTYWAHKGVGAENKQYCCLLKNWGEDCPICEYRQELEHKGANEDIVRSYWPKKRQIMAFIDVDAKEKGIQIFEGPYAFGLGQLIDNKTNAVREGSPVTRFYYADGGMTLSVSTKSEGFKTPDGNSGKFIKPVNIEMEPRETNYEDLEVPCLDDLLKKPNYDKLKEIFHKGVDDAEEDEETQEPTRNGKAPESKKEDKAEVKEEEDDDEDEDEDETTSEIEVGDKVKHPKYGVCSVIAVGDDGKLKLKDKEGNTHRAIKPSEVMEATEEKAPEVQSLKKPKVEEEE